MLSERTWLQRPFGISAVLESIMVIDGDGSGLQSSATAGVVAGYIAVTTREYTTSHKYFFKFWVHDLLRY